MESLSPFEQLDLETATKTQVAEMVLALLAQAKKT
jgi:hypothetical protein